MSSENWSIWVGDDPRETAAYAVARQSIRQKLNIPIPIRGLVLDDLRKRGMYYRPTEKRLGRLFDVISKAPMATEFALSRFLVPHLAQSGWAMFTDCDVLCRSNLAPMFHELDPQFAVYCVKHRHVPTNFAKMDGQLQTTYPRKNWSSVMVFNCDHPANQKLTVEYVNTQIGLGLHQFAWLDDEQIGELDQSYNFLVGHTDPAIDPKIVHFTDGGPWLSAFDSVPFADEWRDHRNRWAL